MFVRAKWTLDDSYAAAAAAAAGGTKLKGRRPKFPERERERAARILENFDGVRAVEADCRRTLSAVAVGGFT